MKKIEIVKGDTITKKYQLKENGSAKDITGMTFKLGVKAAYTDTSYLIGPITGTIDDASNGKFSFTFTSTETATALTGVFEITMTDGSGNRTTLTPPGGVPFEVVENIID